jgi:gas vesicle protein
VCYITIIIIMAFLCGCLQNDVVESQIGDGDLEQTSSSLRAVGRDCHRLAKETMALCDETMDKSDQVVSFGEEIQSTLVELSSNMDASTIDTIRDLIDGDKVTAARSLAGEMDGLAKTCVTKSVEMITRMQDGVEGLPDLVKNFVKRRADKIGVTEEEQKLRDIEPDIKELEACVNAVTNLKLVTAMEAGTRAYSGITSKSGVCKILFEAIRKFAEAFMTIADAFLNIDVGEILNKAKDVLRCIRLSSLMKQLAEEAGHLIQLIINVFQGASGKLSNLWAALSQAKDTMLASAAPGREVKKLCEAATDRGFLLEDKTRGFSTQTRGMGDGSAGLAALKSMATMGKDIREAIDLAHNLDGLVDKCSEKVGTMVSQVKSAYDDLPEIVTDGIPDMVEAGASEDDPAPPDVEGDVEELESARYAIDNADIMSAVRESVQGFSGVSDKVAISNDMLQTFKTFSESITSTIDAFLGAWNLETAKDKIIEICRLITLGELMKQFAVQIKRLLQAIILLLKSIVGRVKKLHVPDSITDTVNAISDLAGKFNIF